MSSDPSAANHRYAWFREVEHARELLGSGLWQAQTMGLDLPPELSDAYRALDAAIKDEQGQVNFGIDILARVPHESGMELGELIEHRRGEVFAR